MIVIYSMDLIKCIRTPMMCKSILTFEAPKMLDLNDCVWIIPGMFDELYND